MSEQENNLFRKSSLERVSSPEQLNEYIKVTNPSLISLVIGVLIIVGALLIWVFTGGINDTVNVDGIALHEPEKPQMVYCYVSIAESKKLKVGMEAQVSPNDYTARETDGYIKGKVESIGDSVITENYLISNFESPQMLLSILPKDSAGKLYLNDSVEVQISLGEWSMKKSNSIKVTDGSVCSVSIISSQIKPYSLIFDKFIK